MVTHLSSWGLSYRTGLRGSQWFSHLTLSVDRRILLPTDAGKSNKFQATDNLACFNFIQWYLSSTCAYVVVWVGGLEVWELMVL